MVCTDEERRQVAAEIGELSPLEVAGDEAPFLPLAYDERSAGGIRDDKSVRHSAASSTTEGRGA